jgi:hypothetical protein
MKVIHVPESLPEKNKNYVAPNTIFLAGPTPRHAWVKGARSKYVRISMDKTWRPRAIRKLRKMGFEGSVFIPETAAWDWCGDYKKQVYWEWYALGCASCVVFWVPREMDLMPALTTNIEYGFIMASKPENVVLGYPHKAPKMRYLETIAKDYEVFADALDIMPSETKIPVAKSLSETMEIAMKIAKERS